MKVAIVHDWFVGGGAERVVEQLHKMYPEAPIYTSYCTNEWREQLDGKVITGFLQKWPFPALRKFVPFLRIWWFSRLNFDNYDLVISSSGAEAKGVRTKPKKIKTVQDVQLAAAQGASENRKGDVQNGTLTADRSSQHSDVVKSASGAAGSAERQAGAVHILYCHAPTHYYWSRYDEYLKSPGFGFFDPLARLGLRLLVGPLRHWDFKAAQRPDFIIANSNYTKEQIKKYYGREATVIHPPVDIERFAGGSEPRHGFVAAGRQTPYKRIDLAVAACTRLGLPLIVIGSGPDHAKLKKLAGKSVTFLRGKNDEEVAHYFQTSQAFIFPGIDDFGIVAVESLAAGTPVIALKAGGALDYVKPGQTGLFFEEQTTESLEKALRKFNPANFNPTTIAKSAQGFSADSFRRQFQKTVERATAK